MTNATATKSCRRNEKGEKLYPISVRKHQHNMDTCVVMLRNRADDAEQAGDDAAAERIWARVPRAMKYRDMLTGCCGVGWFTWAEYQDCMAMIEWVRGARMVACEKRNIPYVE